VINASARNMQEIPINIGASGLEPPSECITTPGSEDLSEDLLILAADNMYAYSSLWGWVFVDLGTQQMSKAYGR
jgi:hypothetical protein